MLTWRVLNSNTVPGTVLLMPAVNSQKLMSTKSSSIAASTSILTFFVWHERLKLQNSE